jgi:hypothetical protein
MPKMTSTDDRQTDASDHPASIARWDDESGASQSLTRQIERQELWNYGIPVRSPDRGSGLLRSTDHRERDLSTILVDRSEEGPWQIELSFQGEYWVYVFAAASIVLVGRFLYMLDGPIKFDRWLM